MSRGATAKRVTGRGVALLAGMAITWAVSRLKSAVSRDPDKDWDPGAQVQRQLQAQAGELLTMQVKNPYVPVWANLTFVSMSTDTYVMAGGGDVVDESAYHGSSLESIALAHVPSPGRWVEDYGSSRAGGGDRYVYVRQPVTLELAPFEHLIAHAKANKLPLDMLRRYCQDQLAEAGKHPDNPNIPIHVPVLA
jgi:hypothetical protein